MDFPDMIRLRQAFDRTMVKDIPGAVLAELRKLSLEQRVRPGQRIALTGGSRGVGRSITNTLVIAIVGVGIWPAVLTDTVRAGIEPIAQIVGAAL